MSGPPIDTDQGRDPRRGAKLTCKKGPEARF
jgi:hypothetical protein